MHPILLQALCEFDRRADEARLPKERLTSSHFRQFVLSLPQVVASLPRASTAVSVAPSTIVHDVIDLFLCQTTFPDVKVIHQSSERDGYCQCYRPTRAPCPQSPAIGVPTRAFSSPTFSPLM